MVLFNTVSYPEVILEAAIKLFLEKGYANTSMDEIASAVGLTKGGIYYYIDKKEDLLISIHNEFLNELCIKADEQIDEDADALDNLMSFISVEANIVKKYQRSIRIFFAEMHYIPENDLKIMFEARKYVQKTLENIINLGIKRGTIRKDCDPKIISLLILGMVNWIYTWYRADGEKSFEHITDEINKLIINGIGNYDTRTQV